jgi:hypothetical protein
VITRKRYGEADGLAGVEADFWSDGRSARLFIHGTDHWKDWLKNADVRRHYLTRSIWVHRGVWTAAMSLAALIAYDLRPIEDLELEGFSAGGPEGQILAWTYRHLMKVRILTYGAPAGGNAEFARILAPLTTRYVCRNDLVPDCLAPFGCRHGEANVIPVKPVSIWPWTNHARAYQPVISSRTVGV